MKRYPVILTIAGSDCSGGAGIQADIKTISALGCYAASVITAVTVQNTQGVKDVHAIPLEIVRGQIEAVMDDLHPDAIKIGMVNNRTVVTEIVSYLQKHRPSCVIYDPIMVSTSGRRLMDDTVVEQIKNELFPLVHLITPNLDEVATLTGHKPTTLTEMKEAARELSDKYHTAVLVKGGHLNGNEMYDVLHEDNNTYVYKESKIESDNLHGTGCTLSSSIATYMAKGCRLNEAIDKSKHFVSQSIDAAKGLSIGSGNGPLWHFHRNNL